MNLPEHFPRSDVSSSLFISATTIDELRRTLRGLTPEIFELIRSVNDHPFIQTWYRRANCFRYDPIQEDQPET